MKLIELFDIKYGVNLELINCELYDGEDAVNFVARTSQNNGVVAKVRRIEGVEPQEAGTLTVAAGGSVLSTFVQPMPYYSGRDLYVLTPKKNMSFNEKIFYAMCIKNNAYRYNYGRQANKTLRNIEIPDTVPAEMMNYKIDYSILESKVNNHNSNIDVREWKNYSIKKYFMPYLAKAYHKENLIEDINGINYVTRTGINNGIEAKVKYSKKYKIEKANAITIGAEGVVFFFQEKEFICGNKVSVLRNANLNKYNALFIISVLNYNLKLKYSYGRALVLNKLIQMEIPLPQGKDGEPDWLYMEKYIKSLKYSDKI